MDYLPRFRSYGNYSSDNYGAHSLEFTIGVLTVYFSYQTPVAFCVSPLGLLVRENEWGSTTGKHLNTIDGGGKEAKKRRVPGPEFEEKLIAQIKLGQPYNA